jgi:hypothetical protein
MDVKSSKGRMLSVFVSTAITAKQVAQRLGATIGLVPCVEHPEKGSRWRWRLLGVDVILFDFHGLVNDCGIDFEAFQLQIDLLGLKEPRTLREMDALVGAVAYFLAAEAAKVFQCKTMVVDNLQRELATFGD